MNDRIRQISDCCDMIELAHNNLRAGKDSALYGLLGVMDWVSELHHLLHDENRCVENRAVRA